MEYKENGRGAASALLLYDRSGASLGSFEQIVETFGTRPSWLPGDLGVVVTSGGDVVWIRRTGSGLDLEPLTLDRAGTEALFVLTP